jgi:hypothetical protein
MRIIFEAFYCAAFLSTSSIHLHLNGIVERVMTMIKLCLASPEQSMFQSTSRLHSIVLLCFMLALCFDAVSAAPSQAVLSTDTDVLKVSMKTRERS